MPDGENLVPNDGEAQWLVRILKQWGYKRDEYVCGKLNIFYRGPIDERKTTDEKVIEEVLVRNEYQTQSRDKTFKLFVESSDTWLDLGGNIGTFALLILSKGARVLTVEPEPENLELLDANLNANFGSGHRIVRGGVALENGTMNLYLCGDKVNKYRHSIRMTTYRKRPRDSIPVDVFALSELLNEEVDGRRIDAVKMDIEGMEIELLEAMGDQLSHLKKLVFEYTFDYDRSIPRFLAIIEKLRLSFGAIHHRKVNPEEAEYLYNPPCVTVYCVNA